MINHLTKLGYQKELIGLESSDLQLLGYQKELLGLLSEISSGVERRLRNSSSDLIGFEEVLVDLRLHLCCGERGS
jgi:hypothetical protein